MSVVVGFTLEEAKWYKPKPGWIEISEDAPEEIRKSIMEKSARVGIRTTEPGPEYWEEDHFFDSWDANR